MDAPRYAYGEAENLPHGHYYARNRTILREIRHEIEACANEPDLVRCLTRIGHPGLALVTEGFERFSDLELCSRRLEALRIWITEHEPVPYNPQRLELYGIEDIRELALDALTLIEHLWCAP